jgi:spoIIIJ-associated protein
VSQGESAVTEPYGSATDEARAGRAPEEAVAVEPDAGPVVGNGVVDNGVDESAAGNGVAADTGLAADADPVAEEDLAEDGVAGDGEVGEDPDSRADQGPGEAEPGPPDLAPDLELEGEIAADYIEGLLDVADLDGDIDMDVEGDRAVVSVVGATLDELVGPKGEVLEALQELTRLAVHRQTGARTRIMIDVGGYRLRRRSELAETGRDAADEVKRTGEPKKLWPMNPFERKIVHDAVAAAGLRSESEGEEPDRRVVVLPAG